MQHSSALGVWASNLVTVIKSGKKHLEGLNVPYYFNGKHWMEKKPTKLFLLDCEKFEGYLKQPFLKSKMCFHEEILQSRLPNGLCNPHKYKISLGLNACRKTAPGFDKCTGKGNYSNSALSACYVIIRKKNLFSYWKCMLQVNTTFDIGKDCSAHEVSPVFPVRPTAERHGAQ